MLVLLGPSCLVGLHLFVPGTEIVRLRGPFGLKMADNLQTLISMLGVKTGLTLKTGLT